MFTPSSRVAAPLLLLLTGSCAGGGSGNGGGGGPIDPPTELTEFTAQAGLACIAPGPGSLRIDFTPPPSANFEVAAFVSTNRGNLFASAPQVPMATATNLMLSGLSDGTEHFIGLGIRPTTGGAYLPIGPVLTATPGAPFYVDASAAPGGDGLSPATAFNDMFTAVLNGFAMLFTVPGVSVNIWIKAGDYQVASTLPVAAGVNLYGGFGPAFDLATRDVANTPSILRVLTGQKGIETGDAADNSLPVIVDGLSITGNGLGNIGIESNSSDPCSMELRCVIVTDMRDRGIRARNVLDANLDVVMTNCQSSRNGADGLSGSGAFDYIIYNSIFASNIQEGLDLDGLVPETGGTATLNVRSSQFFGNGAEGLDCTLSLPFVPTSGAYSVQVLGCAFERNAQAGCLIDADFELAAGYSANILVRESSSRGNSGYGFHLDLDSPLDVTQNLTAFLYRVLATSNVLDGLLVSSESRPGLLGVSGSALVGNIGAGIRIEGPPGLTGNRTVVVTHSLLAGNFGGGMVSRDTPATATSAIAYLQTAAFDANTFQFGTVDSDSPAAVNFVNAPEEYARVQARSGAVLTLAAPPSFPLSAKLELANDGSQRTAASSSGNQVTLGAAPEDFGTPGLLSVFPASALGVLEDYRLGGGSIALGAGMNGADAGPFGKAAAGPPGLADEIPVELFYALDTVPALSDPIGANQSIVVRFSKNLNGSTANAGTVRARRGGNSLNITMTTSADQLTILAPGAGWGSGDFRVELDGLRASDGTELSGAIVLPWMR